MSREEELKEQIQVRENQIKPLKEELNNLWREQAKNVEERIKKCYTHTDKFEPKELRYAATARCVCGAGFAYPKNSGMGGCWHCSAILTGVAEKGTTHDSALPFRFYEVNQKISHQLKEGLREIKMKVGNRYLVKGFLSDLTWVKCLEDTVTSYKIAYENGNTLWVSKEKVQHWQEVEDLGPDEPVSLTLFLKVKELLELGYNIQFARNMDQFQIIITKLHRNKLLVENQMMPIEDHFVESRVLECIHYMEDKLNQNMLSHE